VKLLFDQNLSPKLIDALADLYPGSAHVFPLGLHETDDLVIREYARLNDFFIVTKDADFSDLCLLMGFPPKVIWIRLGNCFTSEIERLLREKFIDIDDLDKSAVIGVLTLF
jgi:predicted nuclease of predicted toxin-antitoxin system